MTTYPRPYSKLADVLRISLAAYGVRLAEAQSKSRHREIVDCRRVFAFVARRRTTASFPQIGAAIGKRHSTVFEGVQHVRANLERYGVAVAKVEKGLEEGHSTPSAARC